MCLKRVKLVPPHFRFFLGATQRAQEISSRKTESVNVPGGGGPLLMCKPIFWIFDLFLNQKQHHFFQKNKIFRTDIDVFKILLKKGTKMAKKDPKN